MADALFPMTMIKGQMTVCGAVRFRVWGILCLFWLLAFVCTAGEPAVSFDIQPRVIKLGETATASLSFRNIENPANPGFPEINGFQIQAGAQETKISSVVGGQSDMTTVFNYILRPMRTGRTTIGPFSYDDRKGHVYELPGVSIEVVDTSAAASAAAEPVFARLEPSTTNLYVQQVFDLTLKIYVSSRHQLHSPGSLQNMPSQGLVTREWRQLDTVREVVNSEVYNVHRFSTKAQALVSKQFDLAPMQRIELVAGNQRRRDTFFDSFFGMIQTEAREIAIQPLSLVIKDLPADGRPATFSGAVGQFNFDVSAKPLDLNAGDPITLSFKIAGRGNIESTQIPSFELGDLFKTYEAKLTGQNINAQAAAGEKTFDLVVIPKTEDAKAIPEIVFAFFDPEKNAYESVKRGPFPLVVHPKSRDQTSLIIEQQAAAANPETKAATLGADIVYLKPAPRTWLAVGTPAWFQHPAVLAVQAIPALAVAAAFLLVRRRELIAGDIARSRRAQAPKAARAGIARARSAIAANDAKSFYEALWEAMSSYFGNRFNLPPGEVSAARIDVAFAAAKFEGPQRQLVGNLFATCEQARFGGIPAFDAAASEKLVAELEDALRACERIAL